MGSSKILEQGKLLRNQISTRRFFPFQIQSKQQTIIEREKDDLTQQANSIAIKAIGWKEGQPVLSPAPGRMITSMDED